MVAMGLWYGQAYVMDNEHRCILFYPEAHCCAIHPRRRCVALREANGGHTRY